MTSTPNKRKRSQASPGSGDDSKLFDVDTGESRPLPTKDAPDDGEDAVVGFSVTWGPEKFSPIQYHMVTLGPFTIEGIPREGETVAQAMRRVYRELDQFARDEFDKQVDGYLDRVKKVSRAVSRSKGK